MKTWIHIESWIYQRPYCSASLVIVLTALEPEKQSRIPFHSKQEIYCYNTHEPMYEALALAYIWKRSHDGWLQEMIINLEINLVQLAKFKILCMDMIGWDQ